eukprot:PITA_07586
MVPEEYTTQQKKELAVHATDFSVTTGHLYKMGANKILPQCVLEFERDSILAEAHGGAAGGHYAGKATTQNIFRTGLWSHTLHKDSKPYSTWKENGHALHYHYHKIFNQMGGSSVYHKKSIPYHPLANGTVEAFNKLLENALTKVCNTQQNEWDVCVLAALWAYRTTCKNMARKTLFRLVYGVEVVMPMEYIVPSLCITTLKDMADREALEEQIAPLMELEEDRFLTGFHQQVQKEREKAWHDCHIKLRTFKINDIVLLYDNKFTKFLGKF